MIYVQTDKILSITHYVHHCLTAEK